MDGTVRRLRARAGYTLLELVVALALASIVLVGLFAIMASMMNFQVEALKKGTVNGWSLASLIAMNREIENASVLVYPAAGASADSLSVCTNYSNILKGSPGNATGVIDASQPIETIDYCYDSANFVIRRLVVNGSCPALGTAPPACTAGNYAQSAGATTSGVIAINVYYANYPTASPPVFTRDADATGVVRLQYVVGDPTSTPNPSPGKALVTNPQSMAFDTSLSVNKQYGNTSD